MAVSLHAEPCGSKSGHSSDEDISLKSADNHKIRYKYNTQSYSGLFIPPPNLPPWFTSLILWEHWNNRASQKLPRASAITFTRSCIASNEENNTISTQEPVSLTKVYQGMNSSGMMNLYEKWVIFPAKKMSHWLKKGQFILIAPTQRGIYF